LIIEVAVGELKLPEFVKIFIWFRSLIGDSTLKKQSNGISFFGPWIIEIYSSVDFLFF
jgi:hypothetical protein